MDVGSGRRSGPGDGVALAAQAQGAWKSYVVKELGIAFAAPGKVETSTGTSRGEVAGRARR